ncbi:MAG TPA: TIGR01777 family protein, partial [Candidatus Eisenbacteria bacterium]|nr:TIGR01777 family protein [Candidatus Eisenbacteria bacterium]
MTVARTIGIAGAGGFVGSALAALLAADGRRIVRFVRTPGAGGPDTILWDPPAAGPDPAALAPLD